MLKSGATIDRYTVDATLGTGGMGAVYRAYDPKLQRHVALKVLHKGDPETARRLLREARAAASIQHIHAVAVYDVGEAEGCSFIAMELVQGRTLRSYVGDPSVPLDRRVGWLLDAASALAAAHRAGVVHRDVKPENVMVSDDGLVKVLDFGIARRSAPDAPSNRPSSGSVRIAGTPQYMAPEQIRAQPTDARADQFAWGVVAYELLTGRLPWGADGALASMLAVVTVEPAALGVPGLAPEIEAAILRVLHKDPPDRFASMDEVVRALGGTPSRRPSAMPPSGREGLVPQGHAPELAPTLEAITMRDASVADVLDAPIGQAPTPTEVDESPAAPGDGDSTSGPARDRPAGGSRTDGAALRRRAIVGVVSALLAGGVALAVATRAPTQPTVDGRHDEPDAATPVAPSSPEAMAMYREGEQALRDAAFYTAARRHFADAVEADPAMAAAHLRLALIDFRYEPTLARASYRRAVGLRTTLDARDRVLLDAAEPLFAEPSDVAGWEKRLSAAADGGPGDAELLFFLSLARNLQLDHDGAIEAAESALRVAPQFGAALWTSGMARAARGDAAGALEAFDRCVRVAPAASGCLAERLVVLESLGECEKVEADARRWMTLEPEAAEAYAWVGRAALALGRPIETVRESLQQSWERFPPKVGAQMRLIDGVRLALLAGDFGEAARTARELERTVAGSHEAADHRDPAAFLVQIHLETGRVADAARIAEGFRKRRAAWTGQLVNSPLNDFQPLFLRAERLAGLRDDAFGAACAQAADSALTWFVARGARRSEGSGRAWVLGYAAPAATRRDALAALDVLPAYLPLPSTSARRTIDPYVGGVYALAGRPADALPFLERATRSCGALVEPFLHTRAHADLGRAREQLGDRAGACAAYRTVESRWGGAQASVTARFAGARIRALRCAAR